MPTEAKSTPAITRGAPSLHLPYQIGGNTKTYEDPKELVIDGQQRLTALVAAMYAVKVKDKNFVDREIKISYNPSVLSGVVSSKRPMKDAVKRNCLC